MHIITQRMIISLRGVVTLPGFSAVTCLRRDRSRAPFGACKQDHSAAGRLKISALVLSLFFIRGRVRVRAPGWERHGSEMMLRMNLTEPRLTRVWPGTPSAGEPQGEMRLLTQIVLTRADVRKAITDLAYAESCSFSANDLALLRRALNDPPGAQRARRRPEGPRPPI
jgi:hypothetical protein